MKPILIFSGTEEGNRLAELLSEAGITCIVSVAKEYGSAGIPDLPTAEIWEGRLTEEEMRSLARQKEIYGVVDATAPGAEDVSGDIRKAVEKIRTVSGQAEEFARRLREMSASEATGKRETLFSGKVLYFRLLPEGVAEEPGRGSSFQEVVAELQMLTGVELLGDKSGFRVRPSGEAADTGAEESISGEKHGFRGTQYGEAADTGAEESISGEKRRFRGAPSGEAADTGVKASVYGTEEADGSRASAEMKVGENARESMNEKDEKPLNTAGAYEDLLDEDLLEELRLGGVLEEERHERSESSNVSRRPAAGHKGGSDTLESAADYEEKRGMHEEIGKRGTERKRSQLESIWEMERRVNSWIPTMLETGKQMPVAEEERTKNYNRIVQSYKGHGKPVFPKKNQKNVVDFGSAVYTHEPVEIPSGHPEIGRNSGGVYHQNAYDVLKNPEPGKTKEVHNHNVMIALIGMGMGNPKNLTVEAGEALEQADYVYGPQELLGHISENQHPVAFSKAEDILPELDRLGEGKAAILFSGDTGFYSDCRRMVKTLWDHGYQNLQIYPGISSVSYFAALCGIGWEDAGIVNACGKGGSDQWGAEAVESIMHREKTFFLMSGVSDMRQLGLLLEEQGLESCQIFVGYELSRPGEKTVQMTVEECRQLRDEGQYVCLVRNYSPRIRRRVIGFSDRELLWESALSDDGGRMRVQTQNGWSGNLSEECRSAVLRRLELTESAVVYDLGSGNGAMAMEIAIQDPSIRVYAVTEDPRRVRQVQENCKEKNILNVDIITGSIIETIRRFEAPTHVLIREGAGDFREILQEVYKRNPSARVVVVTVSMESIGELTKIETVLPVSDFQVRQIQVSRLRSSGGFHRMEGSEPVYVTSFRLGAE